MTSIQEKLITKILIARREARAVGHQESDSSRKNAWSVYGSSLTEYQSFFEPVLDGLTIRQLIEWRKRFNLPCFALDLMGTGQPLDDLPITAGLAVSLGDRNEASREGTNIEIIKGDIMSKSTWRDINNWLKNKNAEAFNLIMCRPVGGFTAIPQDRGLYGFLFRESWEILSPHRGALLAEVPDFERASISAYTDLLNRSGNIEAFSAHGKLMILKLPESPEQLPPMVN